MQQREPTTPLTPPSASQLLSIIESSDFKAKLQQQQQQQQQRDSLEALTALKPLLDASSSLSSTDAGQQLMGALCTDPRYMAALFAAHPLSLEADKDKRFAVPFWLAVEAVLKSRSLDIDGEVFAAVAIGVARINAEAAREISSSVVAVNLDENPAEGLGILSLMFAGKLAEGSEKSAANAEDLLQILGRACQRMDQMFARFSVVAVKLLEVVRAFCNSSNSSTAGAVDDAVVARRVATFTALSRVVSSTLERCYSCGDGLIEGAHEVEAVAAKLQEQVAVQQDELQQQQQQQPAAAGSEDAAAAATLATLQLRSSFVSELLAQRRRLAVDFCKKIILRVEACLITLGATRATFTKEGKQVFVIPVSAKIASAASIMMPSSSASASHQAEPTAFVDARRTLQAFSSLVAEEDSSETSSPFKS